MVITKIIFNTGAMHFSTLDEFNVFVSSFSVIKNLREVILPYKIDGSIISTQTLLISSNTFQETMASKEKITFGLEAEFAALFDTLGWTLERTISYTYD